MKEKKQIVEILWNNFFLNIFRKMVILSYLLWHPGNEPTVLLIMYHIPFVQGKTNGDY